MRSGKNKEIEMFDEFDPPGVNPYGKGKRGWALALLCEVILPLIGIPAILYTIVKTSEMIWR